MPTEAEIIAVLDRCGLVLNNRNLNDLMEAFVAVIQTLPDFTLDGFNDADVAPPSSRADILAKMQAVQEAFYAFAELNLMARRTNEITITGG